MNFRIFLLIAALVLCTNAVGSPRLQQPPAFQHTHDVEQRGDHAMGFDHTRTTHHFLLTRAGGVIQVTANDANDTGSRDQIRMHLHHITGMFSEGNFEIPMFVHDQTPPGVPVMKELKAGISYKYEEIAGGARVVISSEETAAIEAIHQFLTFQIKDHHTGDSLDVRK